MNVPGRTIKNPHWMNPEKTHVAVVFEYDDGRAPVRGNIGVDSHDSDNPDWQDLLEQFGGIEGVDKSHKRLLDEHNARKERRTQEMKEHASRKEQEMLFHMKLNAFEMDEVRQSTNHELKKKIRKAKNPLEIQTYTAAIVMQELPAPKKTVRKKIEKTD